MQGGDVLQRHEDVAVQLDVGDLVDVAVRRQDALLVFAAEERDLDLLALVLAGVVLHDFLVYRPEGAVLVGDLPDGAVLDTGSAIPAAAPGCGGASRRA